MERGFAKRKLIVALFRLVYSLEKGQNMSGCWPKWLLWRSSLIAILLLLSCQSLTLAAATRASSSSTAYLRALEDMAQIVGFEVDGELRTQIEQFAKLPKQPEKLDLKQQKQLIINSGISRWSGQINEYLSLLAILFADLSGVEQKLRQKDFDSNQQVIEDWRAAINAYLLPILPQYQTLDVAGLLLKYQGKRIKIAVFDLFDAEILNKQKRLFPKAKINELKNFGNPVSMLHGNTVIDVLLSVAPELEIIPIAADAKAYAKALNFINEQNDIDIVNMSRTFAQAKTSQTMDTHFAQELTRLVQSKILCKALGNTGTDLDGQLSTVRTAKQLGPVHNLFSYDINLIKEFANSLQPANSLWLLAINLDSFADDTSLTATIPGAHARVQEHSLAVPADPVWSPSVEALEAGSSFAAPQLAALSARLLQRLLDKNPQMDRLEAKQRVVESILSSAELGSHTAFDWGRGVPSAARALDQP